MWCGEVECGMWNMCVRNVECGMWKNGMWNVEVECRMHVECGMWHIVLVLFGFLVSIRLFVGLNFVCLFVRLSVWMCLNET